MDRRKALEPGSILTLYKEKNEIGFSSQFLIDREAGRGGSCIVYDASYRDSVEIAHFVKLKECYPYELEVSRNVEGRLCPSFSQEKLLRKEQKRFINAYKEQVEISQKEGLVNHIIHAFELYYANNTIYSVMDYREGNDYGKIGKEELFIVMKRMRSIAAALQKYHAAGLLYLDLSPENIWIIPETAEIVHLFDHDSVIKKELLPEIKPEMLSYREGIAPPELIARDYSKIGETSDIYELGAVCYYKLMGRYPERQDREYGAQYDFAALRTENALCSDLFFAELQTFFSNTLAAARRLRYQTMGAAIEELDCLVNLSDISAVFPIANFSYNQNCFVGRKEELEQIRQHLTQNHLLFLHGIGGIGKTELAARYAYESKEIYHMVLFLRVEHNLLESLCRDDISLNNFQREEEESTQDYGKRKLKALKASIGKRSLLILDNFDEEDDEMLEEFLELPCHILVTSRCDYSDWNYPQIEVEELGNMEDLLSLFSAYNPLFYQEYEEEERQAVEDIIKQMDCHTMLTELLAKNLRVSGLSPIELRERLRKEQGIIGAEPDPVRHRKDKRRREISVQSHLKILFDISCLTEAEVCLLDNLSLFAGVHIKKNRFLEWCRIHSAKILNRLVQKGWIEEETNGKISLHQIILDLIYEIRKPGGGSCPDLTHSMTEYAIQKPENRTQRDIRNRLCGIFGRRLQGKDMETLTFYLAYCEHVHCQKTWLAACLEQYEKKPENYREELAKVYYLKGQETLKDLGEYIAEEDLQQETAERAVSCFERSIQYKNDKSGQFPFLVGKCCYSRIEHTLIEDSVAVFLYDFSRKLMEEGVRNYEQEDSRDKKILSEMYERLMDFYDPDAFVLIRPEHFGSIEKRLYYGNKKKSLDDSPQIAGFDTVSYTEAGEQAERKGELPKALEYYKKAAAVHEEDMIFHENTIGLIHEKLGEYQDAISFFMEKQEDPFPEETMLHIGRLYRKLKDFEKAGHYIEKSINICRQKIKEEEGEYWNKRLFQGYLEKSQFPGEAGENAWKQAVLLYQSQEENLKKQAVSLPFQINYAENLAERAIGEKVWESKCKKTDKKNRTANTELDKTERKLTDSRELEQAIKILCDAGQNCLENYIFEEETEKIITILENIWELVPDFLMQVQALSVCAKLLHEQNSENEIWEKECYEKALGLLEEMQMGETAEAMIIRNELAELCSSLELEKEEEQYKKSCDYKMIAQWKIKEVEKQPELSDTECLKEQIKIWKESGESYKYVMVYEDTEKQREEAASSYKKAAYLWNQLDIKEKEKERNLFCRIMEDWSKIEIEEKNFSEAEKILSWWHREILSQYSRDKEKGSDISWELNQLAEQFGKIEDIPMQILCSLERGITELKAEYHGQTVKTEKIAEKIFFRQVEEGLSERQADMVLEICDKILDLCGEEKQWKELCKLCKCIITHCREEQISFK